ncbi:hypothetical protein C8Q76DRAFT_630684, partial [Earliella scabrosa]
KKSSTRTPSPAKTSEPTSLPHHSQASHPSSAPLRPTLRELYQGIVRSTFPNVRPRSDFDLMELGAGGYEDVSEEDLIDCLDEDWEAFVEAMGGDAVHSLGLIQLKLNERPHVTGTKPSPGSADVIIQPIPGSEYCLRIWPGSLERREHCVDFVLAEDTNRPVGPPRRYKLCVDSPTNRRWFGIGLKALKTLEEIMGVPKSQRKPEEVKFVVLDGMSCVLTGPKGIDDVRIDIPVR